MNFGSGLMSSMHRGVTLGGPWLDPNASFTTQALGGLSARDWLHGVVAWWNPYTGAGLPLAGEMQTSAFFLPFVLLLHFASGLTALRIALQVIAGIATYALIRQLGLGRLAAFAAAAVYEFNGVFAWFAHGPIMPLPFLPLLLLGIERAFACAEDARRGGSILIGVAVAYSLYAGFPETAFLNGLLALVWTLYRLTAVRSEARLRFAAKVLIGGIAGLLLSAPIVVPFVEYQRLSGMAHTARVEGLAKTGLAGLLFPYIYGPVGAFSDVEPTRQLRSFWGGNGGYLDLTVVFLAILGTFTGTRSRVLRILLLLWMAVFLAKVMDVFHMSYLFSLIPGMKLVIVNRYCEASWIMAAAVLAAFALDDWRRSEIKGIAPIIIAVVASLLLACIAIGEGSGIIHSLLAQPAQQHYPKWLWGSLGWTLSIIAAVVLLYFRRPGTRTATLLGAAVAINGLALYTIPTLAGVRNPQYDYGLIHFLQRHLRQNRFYTLGPFSPNYGAYFNVASINHNAIPISQDWVRYVRSTLDPAWIAIDPSVFVGYAPAPFEEREKDISTHLIGFEGTAVKYIVAPTWSVPFSYSVVVSGKMGSAAPLLLQNGQQFSGVLTNALPEGGWIRNLGVVIGIYGEAPSGEMRVNVCIGGLCGSGIKSLAGAQNGEMLSIPLNASLHFMPGQKIRYELTYLNGKEAARRGSYSFVWLWPGSGQGAEPQITLTYSLLEEIPRSVYHGQVGNVFELPHPEDYFDILNGNCSILPEDREKVRVSCPDPAVLIRRELFYPGWRAFVDGRPVKIKRSGAIFQSVYVPAGHSTVTFSYRPTHAGWLYASAIAGLLCLAFSVASTRMRRMWPIVAGIAHVAR